MKNIAVIGYGVIGKRVADAVNARETALGRLRITVTAKSFWN